MELDGGTSQRPYAPHKKGAADSSSSDVNKILHVHSICFELPASSSPVD